MDCEKLIKILTPHSRMRGSGEYKNTLVYHFRLNTSNLGGRVLNLDPLIIPRVRATIIKLALKFFRYSPKFVIPSGGGGDPPWHPIFIKKSWNTRKFLRLQNVFSR